MRKPSEAQEASAGQGESCGSRRPAKLQFGFKPTDATRLAPRLTGIYGVVHLGEAEGFGPRCGAQGVEVRFARRGAHRAPGGLTQRANRARTGWPGPARLQMGPARAGRASRERPPARSPVPEVFTVRHLLRPLGLLAPWAVLSRGPAPDAQGCLPAAKPRPWGGRDLERGGAAAGLPRE